MDTLTAIPNGGFPQIYLVDEETSTEEITPTDLEDKKETIKKREFQAPVPTKIVDIKNILAQRRHITPYISLDIPSSS